MHRCRRQPALYQRAGRSQGLQAAQSGTAQYRAGARVAPQQKPANFPSVDSETQKQRDAGRRKILEQELAQEQQQLDTAKKQLAEQQDIRLGSEKNYARVEERLKPFESRVKLHESNIESLKRELANIK